ncbi:hypothetical protein TVAG_157160 [Trichomonas vaginalis G3]|uniref:Uncharacterized protein n=1 Tax=Trichomonas vaginalis (strain ATCC PRA-98 / G3) TaxID=412133 RepID=A2E9I8_TRIV3|nr:biological adhesion protein [Trichomonas vaginalis G3]EAY10639.1 hypothetical protein TVAG_157160 [Trichomonas vaginalis G3]KAI5512222.1 biological adhesion protein [Trichomonas vaginalis G3]|eukprot:XP_001322862.1 hypothetical protein [Trichomonas vaginalis G3]
MFDSSSDTEHEVTASSQLDTTTDSQLLVESRNEQLQEELASLTKQYNSLQAQFEQAVKLTQSVDTIHKENEGLKVQIRELTNEKQDLLHRLEIAKLAHEEVLKKFQSASEENATQRDHDISGMQKEFEKVKQTFRAQIDSLYAQLQSVQQSKEKEEVAQKTLISKIQKLIDNSGIYFSTKFESFEELCSFFETKAIKGPSSVPKAKNAEKAQTPVNVIEERSPEYEAKIKELKVQLKKQISVTKDLEEQIRINARSTTQLTNKHNAEVESLKAKIAQINEDNANTVNDYKRKITNLENKIAAAKDKDQKPAQPAKQASDKAVPAQEKQQPVKSRNVPQQTEQPKAAQPTVQIPSISQNDLDTITQQYTNRISELNEQIQTLTKKYNDAMEVNKTSEAKCGQLIVTLDKNASEYQALKRVHEETVCEIEAIRKALHSREAAPDKKAERERRKEQQKQKATIICLEKSAEALKKQIFDIQFDKEEYNRKLAEKDDKIRSLENEIKELRKSHEDLNADLSYANNKLENIKIPTEKELLPTAVWTTGEFENPLQGQIEKIADTEALSPAAKIQHIYRQINKYFTKKTEDYKSALDDAYGDLDNIRCIMGDFIVSLTIALNDNAITFDDFLQKNLSEKVVKDISALRSQLVDEKRRAEVLQAVVDKFNASFGNSQGDVTDKIHLICDKMEKKKEIIATRTEKCKAYKQALNDAEMKITEMERDNQFNLETKDMEIKDLTEKNKSLTEQLKQLKAENKQLKDTTTEQQEQIESIKQELEENKESLEEERKCLEETISRKHEEANTNLQSELSAASANVVELTEQCQRLKEAVTMQKGIIAEREKVIEELKADLAKTTDSYETRHEIEKKQIIESYEKAIQEITKQCEMHRSDVEKLSVAIAQTEKKLKDAQASRMKAKRMKVRAEAEIKSLEEQISREKKLTESAIKNAAIANEADASNKINAVKAKADEEKRKLIATAAQEFSQFFNAGEAIDERAFKNLIQKARDEISRLTKMDAAIRRLVGATGNQSTDDAVAQILIH